MKTALITGSSRGIGRAIAIRLAMDGYQVILHGASDSCKLQAVKHTVEENGGVAQVKVCDLTDTECVYSFCESLPPVDVLVLSASVQYRTQWQKITPDACYQQLNCNFLSSLLLIQAVVEHMRKNHWGRIITIGSVQEAKPHPDMLVYSASKAAQTNMTHSLSLQLAADGITVNNVAPGVIYTDRNVQALSDPEYARKVTASIPAGFYGTPEDIAGMVSLLCSEEGRYITGQSIYVDGGKSVQ
jgi:NAD(P)-dependent dehydrogenase (short-subunit alcohol dehydrogenase family)